MKTKSAGSEQNRRKYRMSLKINYAKFSAVFALPQLSEQTLCTASAEALRLLLYLMQNQPQVIDPRYLADRLMIPPAGAGRVGFLVSGRVAVPSGAAGRTDLPAAVTGNTAAAAKRPDGNRRYRSACRHKKRRCPSTRLTTSPSRMQTSRSWWRWCRCRWARR